MTFRGLAITKFYMVLCDRSEFLSGFVPIDCFLKLSLSDEVKDCILNARIVMGYGNRAVLLLYAVCIVTERAKFGKKWKRLRVSDVPVTCTRAIAVRADIKG